MGRGAHWPVHHYWSLSRWWWDTSLTAGHSIHCIHHFEPALMKERQESSESRLYDWVVILQSKFQQVQHSNAPLSAMVPWQVLSKLYFKKKKKSIIVD